MKRYGGAYVERGLESKTVVDGQIEVRSDKEDGLRERH